MSYMVLTAAGVLGLIIVAVQLFTIGELGLPDRAPGLWLAALGLFITSWGVGELVSEPPTLI
jgi:hypothetical protein